MSWAIIIAELITVLGPILVQALQGCAAKKAEDAAQKLTDDVVPVPADKKAAYTMALQQIHDDLPYRRIWQRIFVNRAIATVPESLANGTPLTADDVVQLTTIAKMF